MPQDENEPNLFASPPNEAEQKPPSASDLFFRIPEAIPSKVGALTIGVTKTGVVRIFMGDRLCYDNRSPNPGFTESHAVTIDGVAYEIVAKSGFRSGLSIHMTIIENGKEIWQGNATYEPNPASNSRALFITTCVFIVIIYLALIYFT